MIHQTSGEARVAGKVTQLSMGEIIFQQIQIHVEPLKTHEFRPLVVCIAVVTADVVVCCYCCWCFCLFVCLIVCLLYAFLCEIVGGWLFFLLFF